MARKLVAKKILCKMCWARTSRRHRVSSSVKVYLIIYIKGSYHISSIILLHISCSVPPGKGYELFLSLDVLWKRIPKAKVLKQTFSRYYCECFITNCEEVFFMITFKIIMIHTCTYMHEAQSFSGMWGFHIMPILMNSGPVSYFHLKRIKNSNVAFL